LFAAIEVHEDCAVRFVSKKTEAASANHKKKPPIRELEPLLPQEDPSRSQKPPVKEPPESDDTDEKPPPIGDT